MGSDSVLKFSVCHIVSLRWPSIHPVRLIYGSCASEQKQDKTANICNTGMQYDLLQRIWGFCLDRGCGHLTINESHGLQALWDRLVSVLLISGCSAIKQLYCPPGHQYSILLLFLHRGLIRAETYLWTVPPLFHHAVQHLLSIGGGTPCQTGHRSL